ncbi:MAG: hypothetical protein P4L54_04490 [Acidocella sp.]|nr:hypothetical protein [Acidocella sp.]
MPEESLAVLVAAMEEQPPVYPAGRFAGRGIVICAGGPRYFTCAFVLLHVLRHALGCQLPVQVWHLGVQELSSAMVGLLQGLGAEIVDAEPLLARYPATIRNGWALKPYAVAHSRFAEVLSLDADALPLVPPEVAFNWPQYQETGALFWPDIMDLSEKNPVWAALGLPPRRAVSFETGQFLLDKSRCWAALMLTVALNSQSDRLYQMIHGEKDSFLLAFLCRRQEFHLIEHRPLAFDSDLVQLEPSGGPFIHHRTFSKLLLSGPNKPVFGGALTAAVEAALEYLRAHWTGIVFHPPAMSEAAQAAATALAGQIFSYWPSGGEPRTLVLGSDFQVAEGRAEYEQHWAVVEHDGELRLQLYSATRLAVEMAPQADGSWFGSTDVGIGFSARLVPQTATATMPFAGPSRVASPAAALVAALLAGAGLGAGYDAAVMAQLEAALGLLNNTYDDVPEALLAWMAAHQTLAAAWQSGLRALAAALTAARDVRFQSVSPQPAPMDTLRAGFYDRVT